MVKFDRATREYLAKKAAQNVLSQANARQEVLRDELDSMLDNVVECRMRNRLALRAMARIKDLTEAAAEGAVEPDDALDGIYNTTCEFPYLAGDPFDDDEEDEFEDDITDIEMAQ